MESINKSISYLSVLPRFLLFCLFILQGCGLLNQQETESESESPQSEEPISGAETNEVAPVKKELEEEEPEKVDAAVDIQIVAVGDIMAHGPQLRSAYNEETDSYDFISVFEEVRPIIQEADLAIGNFETTLGGPSEPYRGYPLFSAPDTLIDALIATGFDSLITVNNHSLDSGVEGLRRTARVIKEKGVDAIGTFDESPQSRFVLKEIEGITIAILAYTELINLNAGLSNEELNTVLNLMDENRILDDLAQVKSHEPDIIIAYMQWGIEYAKDLSASQLYFSELLTREGVDIIFGSSPHVIQETDVISMEDNQSFVAYSLGNFISNQRRESLGVQFAPTEDGVIARVDIVKDTTTNETMIQNIEMIPTWVYRAETEPAFHYIYRILPIKATLEQSDSPEDVVKRLKESQAETESRLQFDWNRTNE